ncbi:MAG TPA: hypothetical protein VJB13_00135 [Candidatus Nanoarchaeia archaeon]|nr:hypothetical protein [Candidatus Nanoarchaeia archaeon]
MTLLTKLPTKMAILGLTTLLNCGPKDEIHNNYYINNGSSPDNNDYSCKTWAATTAPCYPSKGPHYVDELLSICQEFDFGNTSEGRALIDCCRTAQCDLQELEHCYTLVPELD